MKPTTRLRILDTLRKQQAASAQELSRALGMTGANVRHHLAVMESSDLIELIGRRHEGRGRPENVYSLSRRVLGDGLDALASALLAARRNEETESMREAFLQDTALRLAGEAPLSTGVSLPRRLSLMVERLNEMHYQSRWEAGADGARVFLGHCPYAAIIADHPELCHMDGYLLEQFCSLPVEQTAKLQPGLKGVPFCTFRVIGNR